MNLDAYMESAQASAGGTMAMFVVVPTDEDVAAAVKWMKGRKNVKNLTPITKVSLDAYLLARKSHKE